ncbi:MAG: Ig-like domain-containing protein, partial [Patescibacteria group bacterium]
SPCTGDDRGLCCGCSQNEDCGDVDKVGCGNDTCCRARPEIDSFAPADDSVNVCRNAEIRATFNELMNISSFSGNIFVAGDYGFQDCPANTVFLAKDNINNDSIFIKAFKYLAKRFNFVNKLALAYTNPTVHNYCAVRGTVRGLNNPDNTTTISFTPYNLLDPSRLYYAIVNGQEDLKGATTGVMNIWGIGYNGPNGETDAPIGFNATKIIHGKIWSFTTLSEEQDRGICQIDRVKIFPNSYLFSTTENNLNDEKDDDPKDKSFDTIADSDKVFIAYALSADDQILAPTKGYWWNWNWSIENGQVVSIADAGLDADGDRQLIRANEGITDSKTNIYAQVNIEGRDDIKRGEAKVWVFLCENPWPPVNNEGLWQPWTDSGQGCLEDSGSCHDTNYEIYYCRDAGAEGTFDDLPAIEDNAVIRGQSTDNTLVCTDPFGNCIGKSKDSACGLNGKCVLAPNILKETYYFREVIPEIMTASFTAEDTKEGGEVLVTWVAPDDPNSADYPTSYKIYYRLKNVSSYSSLEVVSSEVCQTDPCSKLVTGLENEKEYIFSLSSLNEGRAESELFKEISVTPTKQITKPAKPIGLKAAIINPGNKIRVEWKPNADGVTKGYILYYGTSHAIYGKEVDVGDVINYTFDIVGGYAMYFISLKAYDEYDNLSNEYADEIIVIPEKKDFYFVNTLTNVDFENGVVGKVPVDWARSEQKHVKIAITDERAFSGIQSMLLHQDPGIIYPGICRQDICEDYDANNGTDLCFWVPGTPNKCRFTILDREGNIEKEENQVLVLDNTYRVSWGKLVYRIGALNFQVGKQYLIAFYYKGQSASDIKPQLGASLGHISQCESRSKPSVEAKFQDSCTYEMIDDANLDELTDEEKKHWMNYWPCKECDNGRDGGVCYPKCSEQPDSICLNPPFQTKCYQPLRPYCANDINKLCNIDADCVGSTCIKLDSISRQPEYVGPYNGWKLYLEIITFNEELDSHKDKFGKPLNEIGLTIGYNPTSPYCANDSNKLCSEGCDPGVSCINIADGTDIYIDNFIVAEAVEAVEN